MHRACGLASGELIIAQGRDDISERESYTLMNLISTGENYSLI